MDQLCILRDFPEDWGDESSKMADIYSNAFVAIAATGSGDPAQGLFDGQPNAVIASYMHEAPGERVLARTFVQDPGDHHFSEKLGDYCWIFQERRLCRRMLRFGARGLLWHCRTCSDCQCGLNPFKDYSSATSCHWRWG
jgi:Heterokaryon incompatibility protein (HET)